MFLCCLARAWRCPKKKVHNPKEAKSPESRCHCIKDKKRGRGSQGVGGERMPLALAQEAAGEDLGGWISENRQSSCSNWHWSQTSCMLHKEIKAKLLVRTSLSWLGKG